MNVKEKLEKEVKMNNASGVLMLGFNRHCVSPLRGQVCLWHCAV